MKTFLAPRKPDRTAREAAQGCLTANLAVPGLGSIIAGRKVGYVQLAIYFTGFILTITFGLHFVYWALSNWSAFYAEFHGPDIDPLAAFGDLWQRTRWTFLGFLLFGISWLWALQTSRAVMAKSKKNFAPPILDEKI